METTTYIIIPTQDAEGLNWSGLEQTFESCRKSVDGTMCLVSWTGQMPNTFDGVTIINTMDFEECYQVMATSDWYEETEE
jgi:hypothetical protein